MFIRIFALFLSMSLMVSVPAFAQSGQGKSATSAGPRKQLANIVFAGLAGAVLGLSTLSFYGRPQDKLANIPVGFAVGAICGTMFTTYKAVADPHEFYGTDNKYDFRPQRPVALASYAFEF